ncbi:MAG: diacylglycerol kinase family protein [Coleofasciculaceae cyanobacterium SM2_1_6]|nr:diacylglycerol kinase family protein [Coleofasciculaceae cyanobacterium SM2_1_6]
MKWNLRSTLFFTSSTPNPNLLLNSPTPDLTTSIENLANADLPGLNLTPADNSNDLPNADNFAVTESSRNDNLADSCAPPDNLNLSSSPNSVTDTSNLTGANSLNPINQRQLAWKVAPNVFLSFRYAWAGVTYALATQRNLRIHTLIGSIALGLSWFLQIPVMEVAVIGLTIALVLAMELINTAIESVVDLLVKQSYHELAKIAKDCAAGAVLVAALASVFVAGLLLLPPLYQKLLSMI